MKKERAFLIKVNRKERIAGKVMRIRGEWSFYREVTKSAHAFHTFDAWSLQSTLLPILKEDGVKWMYQYDKQAGKMYRISLKDFDDKAVERDFGEGKQLYVSTKYFKEVPGMRQIKRWIKQVELVA